jgi:glucose/arabinose dehydrogenase
MKKMFFVGILLPILLTGLIYVVARVMFPEKFATHKSSQITASPTTLQSTPADIPAITVVAQHLDVPWGIAFLPDNRMLVTERTGKVVIISQNGEVNANPAAAINVNTKPDGEGGLLGIALHPQFIQNHYVYLYYTYVTNGDELLNRVVRMTFANDRLTNEQVILDSIPGSLYHDGGRIKFGPDGYLYITTGDAQNPSQAQDTDKLGGKILRITGVGKTAPGNPFHNAVYSYGHRNPQGLAWDSAGKLWETEHGRSNPTGFDEINLIEAGKNYGWPTIQGDETKQGMITPEKNSGPTTTWAPSGAVFIGNSLFFGGLKGQSLYEAVIQNDQVVDFKAHLTGQFGRLRDVVLGPDGMLYITTSNRDGRGSPDNSDDRIIRVNPTKL